MKYPCCLFSLRFSIELKTEKRIKNLDKVSVRVKFIRIMCVYCFLWWLWRWPYYMYSLASRPIGSLSKCFNWVPLLTTRAFLFRFEFHSRSDSNSKMWESTGIEVGLVLVPEREFNEFQVIWDGCFFLLFLPLLRLVKEHLRRAARINKRSGDTGMRRFGAHTWHRNK